jgi:hypothetical protein
MTREGSDQSARLQASLMLGRKADGNLLDHPMLWANDDGAEGREMSLCRGSKEPKAVFGKEPEGCLRICFDPGPLAATQHGHHRGR